MAVKLNISYETLVELVAQLSDAQQQDLMERLRQMADRPALTAEEKKALFQSAQLDIPVKEVPSIRREDWYDDDGR